MKVQVSLPLELRLEENGCIYYFYLEKPRVVKIVTLEKAWEYYEMRSVRSQCDSEMIVTEPIAITLFISYDLKRIYECEGIKKFLKKESDEVKCKGGMVILRGQKKIPKGFYLTTRIDVIGPRLKALLKH